MSKKGQLIVVSGPSGVGKGTVLGAYLAGRENVAYSVSATTRAPREGEAEGVNYYYRSEADFKQLIEAGEVLEYNYYNGNYYGTLRTEVERRMAAGKLVLLNIDVHGAANIKRLYPGSTIVFLLPPSAQELEARLRGRGTDDEASIERRLAIAREELAQADAFDVQIVNNSIEQAAGDLYALMVRRAGLEQ